MSFDVGKEAEGLENKLWRRWGSAAISNLYFASPTSQLILQPFRRVTYVTATQQSFRCFTYVIGTSPMPPGEPPMPLWWCSIYPWWICNLQWLRPAGLYERCKLSLELKRLKTPVLDIQGVNDIDCQIIMGDTSQFTYQKCLIQFCFISYFNFYVLKPNVFYHGYSTYVYNPSAVWLLTARQHSCQKNKRTTGLYAEVINFH